MAPRSPDQREPPPGPGPAVSWGPPEGGWAGPVLQRAYTWRAMPADTLVLVPTEMERAQLSRLGGFDESLSTSATVGFGPVAAAARCAALLCEHRPRRVLLVGIAGTYDPGSLPPGAATCFETVAIDGVGAGAGEGFLAPSQLGLPQWQGGGGTAAGEVTELLPLVSDREGYGLLLTVCSASASEAQVARRLARQPQARAEDMEAFGVAIACAMAGVPLTVVRGISNRAGERDASRWLVAEALASARERATAILSGDAT